MDAVVVAAAHTHTKVVNMVQIWHNPRCSKSRASLELVQDSKQEMKVYKYLDESPSIEQIKDILVKLGMDAKQLMRSGEDIYKELNIKDIDDEETLVELMSKNPKLIERPIIIKGNKAVIGRPIENTIELLKN